MNVRLDSRLVRDDRAVFEPARDDLFVLDLGSGRYYRLDEVSAFVWRSFDGTRDLAAIAGGIVEHWDVERARAEADVLELAGELVASGLVRAV